MRKHLFKTLLHICIAAICTQAAAQGIPKDFRQLADSLIRARPANYSAYKTALGPYSQDTLLMQYFVREAEIAAFTPGAIYGYTQLGLHFQNLSQNDRALDYLAVALEKATESNNRELRIVALNRLGMAYRKMEAIKSALDYHQEALSLSESIADPGDFVLRERNTAINGIGNIYRMLEQYGLAIEYFQRSLENDQALGNLEGQVANYQNIAECLEALGDLTGAMSYYEDALRVNKSLGSDRSDVITRYGMAHVLAHEEKAAEALEILEAILPKARSMRDPELLANVYVQLGWVLSRLKRYDEARGYLLNGLRISEELNLPSNMDSANRYLHDMEMALGNYQAAIEFYKASVAARRMISNDLNRRYVYEMISKSEVDKRKDQIEILSKENEIVKLRLRRNRTTLLVGALMLVLITLILYILYRQYQLNSEKKVLTLEQAMLRSQMNPHFLFNSLNSIKLYIINNEQKNAVHYLNKFSKLVRKILEASSLKEIPLAEELETVELYMNIENIRFNNEIDFAVEMDPEINPSLVKIPSLILQPFLENAIWHGLSSMEGEKRIRILIRQDESGYITLVIRDNGIGRAEADKLKQRRVLKRKSVGIDITRERLANFSRDYQYNYTIEIRDLFDADGKSAGTEVILKIPTI